MKVEPKACVPDQTAKNETGDFAQFTELMRRVVAVPSSKIKARLEAEKAAKAASRDSVV
jgi:uncharacterized small protein (DUF1192 family)